MINYGQQLKINLYLVSWVHEIKKGFSVFSLIFQVETFAASIHRKLRWWKVVQATINPTCKSIKCTYSSNTMIIQPNTLFKPFMQMNEYRP